MRRAEFWQGKCVVVTGASSGIGLALCRELARHGARIGMIARGRERLEAVCASIVESGAEVSCYSADTRSGDEMVSAVKYFVERYGPHISDYVRRKRAEVASYIYMNGAHQSQSVTG